VLADDHLVEEGRVVQKLCGAVDPQRVASARDHEDQSDVRVVQDVARSVDAAVAGTIQDRDRALVEHVRESRRVAPGADVAGPVRRRGRHEAQRRGGEPLPVQLVQRRTRLVRDPRDRRSHQLA